MTRQGTEGGAERKQAGAAGRTLWPALALAGAALCLAGADRGEVPVPPPVASIAPDWGFLLELMEREEVLHGVRRERKLLERWIALEDSPSLDEEELLEASAGTRWEGRVRADGSGIDVQLARLREGQDEGVSDPRASAAGPARPLRSPGDFDLQVVSRVEGSASDFRLLYEHLTELSWGDTRRISRALFALPPRGAGQTRPELGETFPAMARFLAGLGTVEDGTCRDAPGTDEVTAVDWRGRLDYEAIGRRYPSVRKYLERQTRVEVALVDGRGGRLWAFEFDGEQGAARVRALRRGDEYVVADAAGSPVRDEEGRTKAIEPWGNDAGTLFFEVAWDSEIVGIGGLDLVALHLTRVLLEVGYSPSMDGAEIDVRLREARIDNPVLDRILGISKGLDLLEETLVLRWRIEPDGESRVAGSGRPLLAERISGKWKLERSAIVRTLVYLQEVFGSFYRLSDFLRLADDFLASLEADLVPRVGCVHAGPPRTETDRP